MILWIHFYIANIQVHATESIFFCLHIYLVFFLYLWYFKGKEMCHTGNFFLDKETVWYREIDINNDG